MILSKTPVQTPIRDHRPKPGLRLVVRIQARVNLLYRVKMPYMIIQPETHPPRPTLYQSRDAGPITNHSCQLLLKVWKKPSKSKVRTILYVISESSPHGIQSAEKGAIPRDIGRTKGGLNSKLHAVCDGDGRPCLFYLSAGQVSDFSSLGPARE